MSPRASSPPRIRFSLRLMLFAMSAIAVYFAVVSRLPRDREALMALSQRDAEELRRIAWWDPSAITRNRFTDSLLHDAIAVGEDRVDLVKAVLVADPPLGQLHYREGTTPLTQALRSRQYRVAGALIDAGANVNEADRHGSLPLQIAVTRNGDRRTETVKRLLSRGADPDLPNSRGRGAISHLLRSQRDAESIEPLRLLIDAVENLNRIEACGDAPLHNLLSVHDYNGPEGTCRVFDLLVAHGADVNLTNGDGHSPLVIAANTFANQQSSSIRPVLRLLPIEEWGDVLIDRLLAHGADPEPARNAISESLNRPRRGLMPTDSRVLAAGSAIVTGTRMTYWLSARSNGSVWVHQGVINSTGGQSSGEPFAFASESQKQAHGITRSRPDLPVIPARQWDRASVQVDPDRRLVECRLADHWIRFHLDLGTSTHSFDDGW